MKFSEVEDALEFVSFGGYGENTAFLDKKTGKFYFQSAYGDSEEVPDGVIGAEETVSVPHKRDFNLGSRLVFRFVGQHMSDDYDRVETIFSRRSAYAYFKDLLAEREMLDAWYAYEKAATEKTIREWCADEGIELED